MTHETAPPSGTPGGGAGLPTNRKAVCSVLFGAVAFACSFLSPFGAFVLAVPAVTTGIHGRREIKDSRGSEGGDMVAVIGLTIGLATMGLLLVSWMVTPLLQG